MKTGDVIKTIQIKQAKVSLLAGDIIKIVPVEHVDYNVEMMKEIQEAKKELLGDKKHSVLMIAPRMGDMDKEAKALASGEFANKNAIAKAIVCKNMGTQLLARFFVKYNKPSVEHGLFQTEEEAIVWLKKKMGVKD